MVFEITAPRCELMLESELDLMEQISRMLLSDVLLNRSVLYFDLD